MTGRKTTGTDKGKGPGADKGTRTSPRAVGAWGGMDFQARRAVLETVRRVASGMATAADWIAHGEPLEGRETWMRMAWGEPPDRADTWRGCIDGPEVRRLLAVEESVRGDDTRFPPWPRALLDFPHAHGAFRAVLSAALSPDPEKAMVGFRGYARKVARECWRLEGAADDSLLAETVAEIARWEAAAELAAAEARAARAEAEAAEARGDTEAKAKAKAKAARYEARAEAARKRLERLKAAGGVDMVGQVLLEGKTLSTLTRERGLDPKTVRKEYRVQAAIVAETVNRALPVALEALRKAGGIPPATLAAMEAWMKTWVEKIPGAVAKVLTPKRGRPSRPDAMHKRTPVEGTARKRLAMNGNADALDKERYHEGRDNAGFGGVDHTPPDLEEDGWEGDGAALGDDEDGTGDALTAEERAAARWESVGPEVYGEDD